MKARAWKGTDGSETVLLFTERTDVAFDTAYPIRRAEIWTNLGMWIELTCADADPEVTCVAYAEDKGLEELSEGRALELAGVPMTEDEAAGYGDSQERS